MHKLYNLGDIGLTWLEKRLTVWPEARPRFPVTRILDNSGVLRHSNGTVFGYATDEMKDVSQFNINHSATGKWINDEDAVMRRTLAGWLVEAMHRHCSYVCLIDESMNEPDEKHWLTEVAPKFSNSVALCDRSILYFIHDHTSQVPYVKNLLDESFTNTSSLVAIVDDISGFFRTLKPGSEVDFGLLSDACRRVVGIAVEAYDSEGLVIWTKSQLESNPGDRNPWV